MLQSDSPVPSRLQASPLFGLNVAGCILWLGGGIGAPARKGGQALGCIDSSAHRDSDKAFTSSVRRDVNALM